MVSFEDTVLGHGLVRYIEEHQIFFLKAIAAVGPIKVGFKIILYDH